MKRQALTVILLAGALAARPPFLAAPQKPATGFEVMEVGLAELQKAMTEGRVTSKALVEAYQARIAAYDRQGPALRSIVWSNAGAVKDAEALDRERAAGRVRGPLHGIPVIIKDNYDAVGMPTTAGSIALLGMQPAEDSFQVRKLREAGAVILAKSTMHELASGITTIATSGGQTRNPYDPERNPGGSSGGTGAAIAASFAAVGMGSDTCGSIRIPASHNNLVGLRPTKGLSSIAGIVPLSVTQDVGGPIARSVTDLATVLDATIGEDPGDPATLLGSAAARPRFSEHLRPDALKGARLGLLLPLVGDAPEDQEVATIIKAATAAMKAQGAEVIDIPLPGFNDLIQNTSVINLEFKEDLAAYLEKKAAAPVRSLAEIMDRGFYHVQLETPFKNRLNAKGRDSEDYRTALARRQSLRDAIDNVMAAERLDALVYPTVRRKAARIGDPQQGSTCQLSASTGYPAISVPAGFTDDGLPVGIELFGRRFDDAKLVSFAFAYEAAAHHRRPPALTPPLTRNRATPITWDTKTDGATARFTFDPTSNRLSYTIAISGAETDVRFANIHRAPAGKNGPIIEMIAESGFRRLSGSALLSATDRRNLAEGGLYVGIATKKSPTAVRIQIQPPPR